MRADTESDSMDQCCVVGAILNITCMCYMQMSHDARSQKLSRRLSCMHSDMGSISMHREISTTDNKYWNPLPAYEDRPGSVLL